MEKQSGFTLVELIIALGFTVVSCGIVGTGLYVLYHFLSKFW
jgi:type II secretory pathway pseudopilin PulG